MNTHGKELLDNIVILTERKALPIDVTENEELPDEFITIKELKGDKSLELVYRSLYHHGAFKYTIANSLVRYDENYIKSRFNGKDQIITVPYSLYLKK